MDKIIFIAKFLKAFPSWNISSFKTIEKELKIKRGIFLHAFRVLKKAKAINFSIIPWDAEEEPSEINKFLEKSGKIEKLDLKNKGVVLHKVNYKTISKIIKSPSLLNPIIDKIGICPEAPFFDEEKSKIFFENKECKIPIETIEFYLCKIVFSYPPEKPISVYEIVDAYEVTTDEVDDLNETGLKDRSIRDAMRRVNKKIEENLGIQDFIEWELGHLRIKKKFFKQ